MLVSNWASLTDLIDNVIGDYKKINNSNPLDRTSAIEWAIYIMRECGVKTLNEMPPKHLVVTNNKALIPADLSMLNAIYIVSAPIGTETIGNDNTPLNNTWQRVAALQYVGGSRASFLCSDCKSLSVASPYTFTIQGPYLLFNFTDLDICIDYYGLVLDENGIPKYPDLPSVRECIQSYILYKWLHESYILDDIKDNKYQYLKAEYEERLRNAKAELLIPDMTEARNLVYNTRYRYARYRIPK